MTLVTAGSVTSLQAKRGLPLIYQTAGWAILSKLCQSRPSITIRMH